MSAVDEIDLVAADDRPTPTEIREAVHAAIERCAKEHGGLVHISMVRAYLRRGRRARRWVPRSATWCVRVVSCGRASTRRTGTPRPATT